MNTEPEKTDVLHHIGIINSDLSFLAATYEKLGFTLTPVSLPRVVITKGEAPAELGAGNRCAIFKNNYLELLGVVNEQKWAAITTEQRGPFNIDLPLKRYAGLHVMHFGTNHIEKVKQRLDTQHTPCSDIMSFQRNVQTPGGEKTMHARSIGFPVSLNPEALIQIAQHDTPELVFQPQFMEHANGACDIREIMICVTEPEKYAVKYEDYTGHKAVETAAGVISLDLGLSRVLITSPEGFGNLVPDYLPPVLPFLAAFTVQTTSLDLTRQVLNKNGVAFLEKDGYIAVDRHEAGGCTLIFTEKSIEELRVA